MLGSKPNVAISNDDCSCRCLCSIASKRLELGTESQWRRRDRFSGGSQIHSGCCSERGTNNDLKVYAQRILDDHTLSNAQVQALARLKGVALPDPTKTDGSAIGLSRLTGIEFDEALVREAIQDHLRDI